ncbi:GDSL esterase/lipase At3g62280-like [Capsicum annuum]|uniref:GDSL esterase/lipase At3g62280-like n=1 Tax=Capsicum annuum TaxID=4072 RepID=UPI001FB145C3|nr:GDSL esterase/lipase At3g62280-like [Capsicum annuum]
MLTGENLNMNYLTPYLESIRPNFKNGANFAIGGASTLPKNVLFSLSTQVLQFVRFLQLQSTGLEDLVEKDDLKNALYMIDIGQNDLAGAFTYLSQAQVIEKIPSFISEIQDAILVSF